MRCYSCFKEYQGDFKVCPYCGTPAITEPAEPVHLAPGTVLAGRYILGTAVGSGGFGIVYRAWDSKLETVVAVKEFFVARLVTRAKGTKEIIVTKKSLPEFQYRKERFLAEARNMAKFGAHRSIPNVFEFFEENGTAYIVMEFLSGMALNNYMTQAGGRIDIDFAVMIAGEVANALKSLHEQHIIHRDVAPDNIFICEGKDLKIKLMDLGAAKLADTSDDVIDIILKPGYSPAEQYDNTNNIGPWTDIYALGATLYMMVTGIKPDEATNRKINDQVVPPIAVNPLVSENLNNTIMRAMAVEPHLRFQTVDDFLAALNGEKKVISLEEERKKRKRKRLIGIAAACIVLAVVGFFVGRTYSNRRSEEELKPADISVWFAVKEDSSEEEAMKAVIADFIEKNPNVSVEYKAFPEKEYRAALASAAKEGRMPTLFESSDLPDELLSDTIDLDAVLNSEQAGECLFLDQYKKYYDDKNRMPLGIEVPVAFVITNGPAAIDYSDSYFTSLKDFGSDTKIAVDDRFLPMLEANFGRLNREARSTFMDTEKLTSPVMLSSTMEINEIRSLMIRFEKTYVYYKANEISCRFVYEWSISESETDEQNAALRLLSWMLGNVYQQYLMVKEASDGQIPVNKECFAEKIKIRNLEPIEEIYDSFSFER